VYLSRRNDFYDRNFDKYGFAALNLEFEPIEERIEKAKMKQR
jgi:hypothetical protein